MSCIYLKMLVLYTINLKTKGLNGWREGCLQARDRPHHPLQGRSFVFMGIAGNSRQIFGFKELRSESTVNRKVRSPRLN